MTEKVYLIGAFFIFAVMFMYLAGKFNWRERLWAKSIKSKGRWVVLEWFFFYMLMVVTTSLLLRFLDMPEIFISVVNGLVMALGIALMPTLINQSTK